MSPRVADPAVRTALIETAARLLASEGLAALTARRLAAEAGVTTMRVYTHFEGMDDVRRAVRREGFTRLAEHLGKARPTDDPIADVNSLGAAYFRNAVANPHLYRVMFIDPVEGTEEDDALAQSTLQPLIDACARAVQKGRLPEGVDPADMARELWALTHGVVTLLLANLIDAKTARATLADAGLRLLTAR